MGDLSRIGDGLMGLIIWGPIIVGAIMFLLGLGTGWLVFAP